jgi:hypothetical protein
VGEEGRAALELPRTPNRPGFRYVTQRDAPHRDPPPVILPSSRVHRTASYFAARWVDSCGGNVGTAFSRLPAIASGRFAES